MEIIDIYLTRPIDDAHRAGGYYEKAGVLSLLGRRGEAFAAYSRVIQLIGSLPESADALNRSALSHYNIHMLLSEDDGPTHLEAAMREFEKLLDVYPDYEDAHLATQYLAEIYAMGGELDKAICSYNRAAEATVGERVWALVGLANLHRDNGDYEEAEGLYGQAFAAAGEEGRSKIGFEWALLCVEMGRWSDAYDFLSDAWDKCEKDPHLRNDRGYVGNLLCRLGSAAYRTGRFEVAMERVKEGLKLIDENDHLFTDAQIVLAHCYMAGGETAEARAHYECAISAALATPEEIALAESCLRDIAEQEGT